MLTADFDLLNLRPREICMDAANSVSRLFRLYRSLHDLRSAHLAIPYILFTTCIIHLLFATDNTVSHQNLVEGLQGLDDIHKCHYSAARSFRLIHSLAKEWDMPWPDEMREARLLLNVEPDEASQGAMTPATTMSLIIPNRAGVDGSRIGPIMPVNDLHRKQSLSMFGQGYLHLATHPAPSQSNSVVSGQHYQSPVTSHTPTQPTFNAAISPTSYHYPHPLPSVPPNVSTTSTPPTRNATDSIYWNAVPSMSASTMPRVSYRQMSPIDAQAVIQSAGPDDRLGRDGFKINEDWRPESINGFAPNDATHVYGIPGGQPDVSFMRRSSGYPPDAAVAYQHPPPNGRHEHGQHVYDPAWWAATHGHPT